MRQPVVFFAALGIALGVHRRQRRRQADRRPHHQDQYQPVLRQDEGRRRRGGDRQLASSCARSPAKVDGDNDGQVAAVENLIAAGAKGILITPNDSSAIVPAIEKARAPAFW